MFKPTAAAAKSLQSCLTLCHPIDGSPPPHRRQPARLLCPRDSPGKSTGVGCHFLLQCMHACMLSCFSHVQLCATPWTAAHQAPPSTGFSRQEHWSGLLFPSPVPVPRGSDISPITQCILSSQGSESPRVEICPVHSRACTNPGSCLFTP